LGGGAKKNTTGKEKSQDIQRIGLKGKKGFVCARGEKKRVQPGKTTVTKDHTKAQLCGKNYKVRNGKEESGNERRKDNTRHSHHQYKNRWGVGSLSDFSGVTANDVKQWKEEEYRSVNFPAHSRS